MQGYLKKKSPKSPKTHGHTVVDIWQKRYFVLSDHQLKYYKTEKDAASSSAEPLKMIALVNVQCAAPNPKHTDMFLIDLGHALDRPQTHVCSTSHACLFDL